MFTLPFQGHVGEQRRYDSLLQDLRHNHRTRFTSGRTGINTTRRRSDLRLQSWPRSVSMDMLPCFFQLIHKYVLSYKRQVGPYKANRMAGL